MSNIYAKLFNSILTSSIWSEDDKTRVLWITMLALSDKDGYVSGSIPGLAAMARMSNADVERVVKKLCEPDKYSRTKDHEGRRIEPVEGGWLILNYVKYREIGTAEGRRENNAARAAHFREKHKSNAVVTPCNAGVTPDPIPSTLSPIKNKGGCKGGGKQMANVKKAYGEFGGVWLTDEEHAKLTEKHGAERLEAGIVILDDYMRSKGKRYKDHYATLKASSWVWRRIDENNDKTSRSKTALTNTWIDPNPDDKLRKAF